MQSLNRNRVYSKTVKKKKKEIGIKIGCNIQ